MTPINDPVRILHLEDNPNDAELIHAILKEEIPCVITLVRDREEFLAALDAGKTDLVLSDYTIPSFSGREALKLLRERCCETPFIYISGTIGEEAAIEALLNGATDYILKGNLKRLPPALRRVRREMHERRELRKAEESLRLAAAQLRQAQKMEAVGRLAGGVAHDFNNLLTTILGLSDLSLRALPAKEPARKDLEEIKNTALRAAALTQQLLAFSRKQAVEPRPIDLNEVVLGLKAMLGRLIEERIEVRVLPAPAPAVVRADPGQMEQVLLNLALNARDAMPGGGRLLIEIASVSLDEDFLARHPAAAPGKHVRLSVKDDGEGMTEEVKAHAFEPFFTTKEPGKGTGLGLATCYGIIEQNEGYIAIDSRPGEGTTIAVYLPYAADSAQPLRSAPDSKQALRGNETVLVAEDDASLRRLTARLLRMQGYAVLEAADGRQALEAVRADTTKDIRLVLADTIMPHLGGEPLAEEIRALRPDVKTVVVSGYAEEAVIRGAARGGAAGFIAKPFEPAELARKIRDILDGRS